MSSLAPERFGMTGGSQPNKWAKLSPEQRRRWIERDVLLMKYVGVRWVRVPIPLSELPQPGQDDYMRLLHDNGIEALGLLHLDARPTDLRRFRRDIERAVRANPQIRVWEAGNEPNLTSYWKSAKEDYVPTLQAIYETIKGVDASRQVACAGLSQWKVEPFLDLIVKQQADKWMDIFAYHPYGSNPQKVANIVLDARNRLQGSPLYDKPIWITEIGFHAQQNWTSNAGRVPDEDTKADYMETTFSLLSRITQGPIFWYVFQESGRGTYLGYGLLNEKKPEDVTASDSDPNSAFVFSPAFDRYRELSGDTRIPTADLPKILRI